MDADTDALAANSFRTLAKVEANQTVFLSVEFPQTGFTRRLKVLVSEEANPVPESAIALRRIGRKFYVTTRTTNNFWFAKPRLPIIRIDNC